MLFISPSKPFLFSRYSISVLTFRSCIKTTRKLKLIFKNMTSQPGKLTIAIHILSNISRNKRNKVIKFGQLIKCNMTNIFPNKSYSLFPDPFLKDENWGNLWIYSLTFHLVCFYCMPSSGLSKYVETKLQTSCFYVKSYSLK